jgi:hypothetical protein
LDQPFPNPSPYQRGLYQFLLSRKGNRQTIRQKSRRLGWNV